MEEETGIRYGVSFSDQGEWVNIYPRRSEFGAGNALVDGFSTWQTYEQFVIGAFVWAFSHGFPSMYKRGKRMLDIAFSLDEAQWAVEYISEMPDDPVVITDKHPDGIFNYDYHDGKYAFEFVR